MKNGILTLLLIHLALFGISQELSYEVASTYTRPIVKETLDQASSLSDINPGYPSSWIGSHVAVEVQVNFNDEITKATGPDDHLNDEQLALLRTAEIGADIVIDVKYYPKNALKGAAIQTINFSFSVIPAKEAEYPGGYQLLKAYLKKATIDHISPANARQLQMAAVRFTVAETGEITDVRVSSTSGNEETDNLLLQTIRKMDKWRPAEKADGTKVKQEFELSVGNMDGC